MTAPKLQVADRDDSVGTQSQKAPQSDGCEGVALSNLVTPIASENFHVLLFVAEDSLTLVRSVLHAHPIAFNLVLGDSPARDARLRADLAHPDEMTSKSVAIGSPHQRIHNNLDSPQTDKRMKRESVASIVVREVERTIHDWIDLVEEATELTSIARRSDRWLGAPSQTPCRRPPAAEVSPGSDKIRSYRNWPSWRGLPEIQIRLCHGGTRLAEVAGGSPQNTTKASAQDRPWQRVPFHDGDRR